MRADDFDAWLYLDFREYLQSDAFYDSLSPEGQALAPGVVASLDTEGWLAASESHDKNGDMILCIRPTPPVKGNLYGRIFNVVDNTSNH